MASSIILLIPQSEYGRVLVDELERGTHLPPFHADGATGARMYDLETVGVEGFDAALARLSPDWERHLTRIH